MRPTVVSSATCPGDGEGRHGVGPVNRGCPKQRARRGVRLEQRGGPQWPGMPTSGAGPRCAARCRPARQRQAQASQVASAAVLPAWSAAVGRGVTLPGFTRFFSNAKQRAQAR